MFRKFTRYLKKQRRRRSRQIGVETETQPQEHGPNSHHVGVDDVELSFAESPGAARAARASARSSSSSARRASAISSTSPIASASLISSASPIASASPRVTVRTKQRATSAPGATKNNKSPKHENKFLPSSAPPALASQPSSYVQNRKMFEEKKKLHIEIWEAKKKLQQKRQDLQKKRTKWDSKLNSLQYSQYYPQDRLYELNNISKLSNNVITKMLEDRFSTAFKFKPSVLDKTIIGLLKKEFYSKRYIDFSNLFIETHVYVDEIYLSVFLSKITIIELDDCVIDEFTLKILSGINKLNVTYIILDYIMFEDDKIFYSFLNFLKGHDNLQGLTLANIDRDIKGKKFKRYMDIIGELKSITWLEFTGIDTIYALESESESESESDLIFLDMFIDLLLKLNNLQMLLLIANKITVEEYRQIFGDYLKIFKFADSSFDFALNDKEANVIKKEHDIEDNETSKIEIIYVKKCIFDTENSNYELQISTDVGYKVKDRSIHFYTVKNVSVDGKKFVDVLYDKIIKKNFFETFNPHRKELKKIDKDAIKKMYLQKKKDELYIMKSTIAQLSKQHLTLEHILEEQDKIAKFDYQYAIDAYINDDSNKNKLLLKASKSSRQATLDMDNANKAIETITKMNNAAELLSKQIKELKKSAGSNSPKKGTSRGGKKTPKRK